jgi:hypothetical protein
MEQSYHKLESLKLVIISHLNLTESDIDFSSRKKPNPLLKKLISYFAERHLSINQTQIAEYIGFKTHSSVSIGISSLFDELKKNIRLNQKVREIDEIIIEKGLSKLSGKNSNWFMFLDLNNFIIATKGESAVLWHKTEIEKVKKILGDSWEYTEHKSTGKFLFKKQPKNK